MDKIFLSSFSYSWFFWFIVRVRACVLGRKRRIVDKIKVTIFYSNFKNSVKKKSHNAPQALILKEKDPVQNVSNRKSSRFFSIASVMQSCIKNLILTDQALSLSFQEKKKIIEIARKHLKQKILSFKMLFENLIKMRWFFAMLACLKLCKTLS